MNAVARGVIAATALALSCGAVARAESNPFLVALANYRHASFGVPVALTMRQVRVNVATSVALPCPRTGGCTRPGRAFIIAIHEGDGGGEALELRKAGASCTDCITSVATAGGGVISRSEVMSFGLTAQQAAVLVPHVERQR